MPLEAKMKLADISLDNNGSLEALERQVIDWHCIHCLVAVAGAQRGLLLHKKCSCHPLQGNI